MIQHICTRLTYHSNAMGYYPIYICHCYDIMANLAASCNDTILVINRDSLLVKIHMVIWALEESEIPL